MFSCCLCLPPCLQVCGLLSQFFFVLSQKFLNVNVQRLQVFESTLLWTFENRAMVLCLSCARNPQHYSQDNHNTCFLYLTTHFSNENFMPLVCKPKRKLSLCLFHPLCSPSSCSSYPTHTGTHVQITDAGSPHVVSNVHIAFPWH